MNINETHENYLPVNEVPFWHTLMGEQQAHICFWRAESPLTLFGQINLMINDLTCLLIFHFLIIPNRNLRIVMLIFEPDFVKYVVIDFKQRLKKSCRFALIPKLSLIWVNSTVSDHCVNYWVVRCTNILIFCCCYQQNWLTSSYDAVLQAMVEEKNRLGMISPCFLGHSVDCDEAFQGSCNF